MGGMLTRIFGRGEREVAQLAQAPAPAAKSTTSALYREVAVDRLVGWLFTNPEIDETLVQAGVRREHLRTLEADDEVSQCLDTRREAVVATPWRLEPQAGPGTDLVEQELELLLEPVIRCAFAAIPYGYSVGEFVYVRRPSGQIGIASFSEKPFEWFEPRSDGSLVYHPEDGSAGAAGILCDPRKFMLTVRNPTYRSPMGEGLLPRLYWPVFIRREGWRSWLKYLERFGTPILVGKTVAPDDFVKAMKAAGIERSFGVRPDEEIEAMFSTGPGEFQRVEDAVIKRIQRLILGQTLTSDVGDVGSYAAAKVHNEVRIDKRNADLRLVSASVQRIVNSLCGLNGIEPPRFELVDNTGLESERATRDATLLPVLKESRLNLSRDYFLDRYDLDEGDLEDAPEPEPVPAFGDGDPQGEDPDEPEPDQNMSQREPVTLAPTSGFGAEQEAIERLADATLAAAASPIPADAIKAAILAARSPEDLTERLAKVYDQADPEAFRTILERALFAADLMGYAHGDSAALREDA